MTTMTKHNHGYTLTPDHLYDVILPQVTDCEWRLLSIILRQTLGWQDGVGTYKAWDWLSHSQLKARMRHSSSTVSKTIASLVNKGLIEVATSNGKLLNTALERRNARTRLYYRLSGKALG